MIKMNAYCLERYDPHVNLSVGYHFRTPAILFIFKKKNDYVKLFRSIRKIYRKKIMDRQTDKVIYRADVW